ncbi:helix-turn-helix domain-containing protein [Paracoccus xiamenensis]|uniref:helix-turn-helix domain-containing protein n=1 Tax=Paracoccus xiamenensis TaxID=2714901 RepID=UPI00140E34EF|nr:AraC family transcriptional regulator [Paracoccus xiamenensis]
MNVAVGKWPAERSFTYRKCNGLVFGGYDKIYSSEVEIESIQPPGLFVGLMLCGRSTSISVSGRERMQIPVGRPVIISFPDRTLCTNSYGTSEFCAGVGLNIDFQKLQTEGPPSLKACIGLLRARFERRADLTVLPALPEVNDLVERTFQIQQDAPFSELELEASMLNFVALICRAVEQLDHAGRTRGNLSQRERNRVRLVTEYLQSNLERTPSLAELAQLAGVNPSTLAANFRSGHGQTIFAFLRDLRLDKARSLLRCQGTSVTEAGMRVGFSSSAAFSTAYRRRFGHSPSQEIKEEPDLDKVKPDPKKA